MIRCSRRTASRPAAVGKASSRAASQERCSSARSRPVRPRRRRSPDTVSATAVSTPAAPSSPAASASRCSSGDRRRVATARRGGPRRPAAGGTQQRVLRGRRQRLALVLRDLAAPQTAPGVGRRVAPQRLEKVDDRGEHERRRGRRHREAVTWQEARLVLRAPAHTVRDTSAPAGGHHATARPYEPHYLGELGGVQLPWRVEHQEDGRCRPPPPPPPPPPRPPAPPYPPQIETP